MRALFSRIDQLTMQISYCQTSATSGPTTSRAIAQPCAQHLAGIPQLDASSGLPPSSGLPVSLTPQQVPQGYQAMQLSQLSQLSQQSMAAYSSQAAACMSEQPLPVLSFVTSDGDCGHMTQQSVGQVHAQPHQPLPQAETSSLSPSPTLRRWQL